MLDETRIDRYLAAVRLVKTRPIASQLCEGGHVRVNGRAAKPSTRVRVGDRVEARIADRDRIIEVVRVIEARSGLAELEPGAGHGGHQLERALKVGHGLRGSSALVHQDPEVAARRRSLWAALDRVPKRRHRLLDDFIFQGGNAYRPLFTIFLVHPNTLDR